MRERDGQKQAKQVSAIDYLEASPITGENCLKVFQRVLSEIQAKETNPFHRMEVYQGPPEASTATKN